MFRNIFFIACICALFIGAFPLTPAFAYLDPGAGSMMLQLISAGIIGVIAVAKLLWKQLRFFKKR